MPTNGDGRPEVLFGGTSTAVMTMQKGKPALATVRTQGVALLERDPTFIDLNGDGTRDIVLSSTGGLKLALVRPDLTIAPPRLLTTPDALDQLLEVGDFDNDGIPDLLAEKRSTEMATVPSIVSGSCAGLREGF